MRGPARAALLAAVLAAMLSTRLAVLLEQRLLQAVLQGGQLLHGQLVQLSLGGLDGLVLQVLQAGLEQGARLPQVLQVPLAILHLRLQQHLRLHLRLQHYRHVQLVKRDACQVEKTTAMVR